MQPQVPFQIVADLCALRGYDSRFEVGELDPCVPDLRRADDEPSVPVRLLSVA